MNFTSLTLVPLTPLNPAVKKKPRVTALLDDCLAAETPEEVLEQLLSITESDINSFCSLAEQSLSVLRELWRRWREKGDVCAVIVRVFVELVTSGSEEWEEVMVGVREFVLLLAEHGKLDLRMHAHMHTHTHARTYMHTFSHRNGHC